jgi:TonB family protein
MRKLIFSVVLLVAAGSAFAAGNDASQSQIVSAVATAPLRVCCNVKAPILILASRVEPKYTKEARKARIFGIVIVECTISKEGDVSDVHVLKPLPFGLDQAAVDAVKHWKFKPATLDGQPVPVIFNLTINFRKI